MGVTNINLPNMGAKTLAAYQTALEITAQNIANINTPGYSRQSVVMQSASVGGGVEVSMVQRAHDIFIQKQLEGESATNGKENTVSTALQRMQPLFNETAVSGVGASMQEFFNAWQDLAANPQGTTERQTVLGKAQSLVDSFHRVTTSLTDISQAANQSLSGLSSDVNGKLKQIADLNKQIYNLGLAGGTAYTLRDNRDQLLQDLSRKVGVSYQEGSNGMVTVTLGSTAGGAQLVSGTSASSLTLDTTNPAASRILVTAADGTTTDVTDPIFRDPKSGEIGGTLLVRDQVVPGFLGKLDELAYTLSGQVNTLQQSGYDLNGSQGIAFFTTPPAVTPPATYPSGYSASISLNSALTAQNIAAASVPNATGDNRNAQAIAALKNSTITVAGGQTSLSGLYTALVGNVGVAVQSAQQGATQSDTMLKQLTNLRESAVGVNLDEELTNMMTQQKAYEAAAKMITTSLEMLQTVLDMMK